MGLKGRRVAKALQGKVSWYNSANVAVKASIWFTICSIIQKSISVLTMPIFTRLMSTEQYGQYSVYLTWYNILMILVTMNIQADIFNKGLSEHWKEKDTFTVNQAALLIVMAVVWIGIYYLFRNTLNRLLGMTTYLACFMILEILGTALVGLWSARKRFEYDYKKIVKVTLAMAVLNPIVGFIAVSMATQKAEAKVIANAIVPVAFAVGILIAFARKNKKPGKLCWWKTVVIASIPLVPHYLSQVLLNQSDKIMINYFTGAQDAAIYSVAHTAGLVMTIVNNSINGSFVPWLYRKIKNQDTGNIKVTTNYLLVIVAFVNIMLIWFAPEALKVLAAPQYSEAAWCLVPIAMSVYFYFAYTLIVDVEIYYGANHYIAIASMMATVINIVLNLVFIPICGYIAAGYTTLFSYFVTMIFHFIFLSNVMKKAGVRFALFDMKVLVSVSVALVICSFVGMLLYEHVLLRISIMLVAAIYVFVKKESIITGLKEIKQ